MVAPGQDSLTATDIVVIAVYIAAVIAVGIWSMFQSKRSTTSGYFLAGRFMTFVPVGMSLFASNIGSASLIGLAGSGAAAGIAVSGYEINALMFLQLLGFLFLPVYIASGVFTLPEYIHKRFGGNRIRIFLSVLSLILYIFTKISVTLYSGALFIQQSVGWDLYISIFGLLLLTGICTVTGGLATVIYLDTLMAFVMVGGATIMSVIGFNEVGGYSGLRDKYMNAVADEVLRNETSCGIPRPDAFQLMRGPVHSDLPWPGFLLGQTTVSIWYWCSDQVIVQRSLAAKSLSHAQGGTILAGYLKLFPLYIMVLPGMISRVLYPNEVACVDPEKCYKICESRTGCTNIAMPLMVLKLMPSGLRGMMLAVMMAALMSDLTSVFNSASTLFTMDIYKNIRKKARTRELMIVGRIFVVILCVLGVAWVPLLKELQGGQLFLYIQSVASYLSPPIGAVYMIAVLWKRCNETGAFWAMILGFIAGITRMILDFTYTEPKCGEEDKRPSIIKDVHFFYVALILFVLTGVTCVVISLLTDPPNDELIIRTTFWTRNDETIRSDEVEREGAGETISPVIKGKSTTPLKAEDLNDSETTMPSTSATKKTVNNHHSAKVQPQQDAIEFPEGYGQIELNVVEKKKKNTDGTSHDLESEEKEEDIPRWKKAFFFICGLSTTINEETKTAEEKKEDLKKVISLEQNPRARKALIANSFLLICVSIFLLIYYTIPDGGPTTPTISFPYIPFVKNQTRPY